MPRPLRLFVNLIVAFSLPLFLTVSSARAADKKTASGARTITTGDLKGLKWRSVGPANMGGRVGAIALAPGNSKTFYVGYGTGGVFKTENFGTTFSPVFDKTGQHSIGAIAVADAPADWKGWDAEKEKIAESERAKKGKAKIVWVGTGEGNNRNSSSWGHGVYRSTDAGGTFEYVGLAETHDIPRIAVDPRNPDVLYVAALGHLWGANPERGVYKTKDGGKTWQQVLKADANTGACDVVIDPQNPDRVYAGMFARRRTPWSFASVAKTGGLYRSDNAGGSWQKLTKGIPETTGRIGIAVFPKDSKIIYAIIESDFGGTGRDEFDDRSPSGGVFKSEDHGDSWTRVNDLCPRPWYFSRITVDPENANRVYVPGWDLAISDDGGKTFRRSGSENVHVDFHAIVIDPKDPETILVGNDGGLYISRDKAQSWTFMNNVAVGEFYRIALDMADPYHIAGGLQDNGSWMGPSETVHQTDDESKDGILNDDWHTVYGSDGFGVAFDPKDPDIMYATAQGGFVSRVNIANGWHRMMRPSQREGQERLRFNWNSPFFVSKYDPTVLYQAGNRVYRITEHGEKWFAISGDLSRREVDKIMTGGSDAETFGTVVSLAESPLKQGWLWAGNDDGLIHVTENDGGSWRDVTPKAGKGLYVSYITASAHDAKTAYVAIDGHRSDVMTPIALMTTNLGGSWTSITGDLPKDEPVQVVIEDPASKDVLYCGTQFFAYVTFDRGAHWLRLNNESLPPVPVHDMKIHPRERDLVVATHGRSIWVLDNISMFSQLTPEARAKPLAVFDVLPARPRIYAPIAYGHAQGIFRAKNPPVGAGINYWVREDTGDPVSISVADSSGFTVRELDGSSRAGLNRVVWDLRPDKKHAFNPSPNEEAGPEQFVPAGKYKITVKMGKASESKTVEVLPFPWTYAGTQKMR
jgi:photosystem II stability/assembly factor-like uncharacterized protein